MAFINEDIWRYIKSFLIFNKEDYIKVIENRLIIERYKLCNALRICEEFMENKSNIKIVILNKIKKEMGDIEYNLQLKHTDNIYFIRINRLLNQLEFLIEKKNRLIDYNMIKRYKWIINFNFFNYDSKRLLKKNRLIDPIKQNRRIKCLTSRIDNLFLKYSIYLK
jgi:hypothetical protein